MYYSVAWAEKLLELSFFSSLTSDSNSGKGVYLLTGTQATFLCSSLDAKETGFKNSYRGS